jgi:hypothetical protein
MFFIFNPIGVTKVTYSFIPWCFRDFPTPGFTMQLMRYNNIFKIIIIEFNFKIKFYVYVIIFNIDIFLIIN